MTTIPTVSALATALVGRRWRLAVAESCTGGLLAAACTDQAGASDWFERGLVVYSNDAKSALLGVPQALIAEHGAVSEAVALAMAAGARSSAGVELGLSVTGIAGPGGGSADKPVGTVWLGWSSVDGQSGASVRQFAGNRAAVRTQSVDAALEIALDLVLRADVSGED